MANQPGTTTTTRAGGRTSPGDYTGRQKAADAKAQAQANAERDAEITVADTEAYENQQHAVFDPQSGDKISGGRPRARAVDEVEEVSLQEAHFGQPTRRAPAEPVLTGHEDDESLAKLVADRRRPTMPPEIARRKDVVIRVAMDVDKMTYGLTDSGEPNNFSFKEGFKYRVPTGIAEHLDERGLVAQWLDA